MDVIIFFIKNGALTFYEEGQDVAFRVWAEKFESNM